MTSCLIAGCGPAGAMLGFLLARAGIDVTVLEKHADFLRDFRGDTVHPSTLEILDEAGLADEFLQLPHSKVSGVTLRTTGDQALSLSLERIPSKFRYIAFVPQWDFLEFMTRHASAYPGFTLIRNAEVIELIEEAGVVRGVNYRVGARTFKALAHLTVGADGRQSITREAAALPRLEIGAPIDVLWFKVSRHADEPQAVAGRIGAGRVLVMLNRNEYWQIAYVIPKGKADAIRAAGLDQFRKDVVDTAPELGDRILEIISWDQVKLLTVRADRLQRWHKPGYLAIGDAAHAMSPIGGVGINVAIHDAVVAANVLWKPLRDKRVTDADLAQVQARRERAVRVMQSFQGLVQDRFLRPALASTGTPSIPLVMRLVLGISFLRDIPPRIIALGIDRPRVESPRAG